MRRPGAEPGRQWSPGADVFHLVKVRAESSSRVSLPDCAGERSSDARFAEGGVVWLSMRLECSVSAHRAGKRNAGPFAASLRLPGAVF